MIELDNRFELRSKKEQVQQLGKDNGKAASRKR